MIPIKRAVLPQADRGTIWQGEEKELPVYPSMARTEYTDPPPLSPIWGPPLPFQAFDCLPICAVL